MYFKFYERSRVIIIPPPHRLGPEHDFLNIKQEMTVIFLKLLPNVFKLKLAAESEIMLSIIFC